jgi:Flp pilus assembly protein TadB
MTRVDPPRLQRGRNRGRAPMPKAYQRQGLLRRRRRTRQVLLRRSDPPMPVLPRGSLRQGSIPRTGTGERTRRLRLRGVRPIHPLGRLDRGRAGRHFALGGVTAALVCALGATIAPQMVAGALLAVVGWLVATRVVRRRVAARRLALRRAAAPAVLDLLGAALLAGLNPHRAVLRVAERAPAVLRDDLGLAAAVLRLGGTPAAALHAAAGRAGLDEFRAAAHAMETAERWGAPPAEALAARAAALRSRARLSAEAEAGRAAVRLAFPLVLCFLPAFALLTVVPTVAGAIRALTP